MLILKERLTNIPILSLQTGAELARTSQPIIDPRELTIVAFYCQGPLLDFNPAILHIDDIREFSNVGFIVDGADVIMPPDGLVRLQQVINFNFALEGKQVVDDTGRKMGKVSNYTVDGNSFYIRQIIVEPQIWQAWNTAEIRIGRQQIIEITDKQIIVKSPTIRKTTPAVHHTLTQNPFKQAQPEASHATHDDA
ncbi:MAG TPA: PRC-barrel domain-containing protein [Candidatus Saccharimonas sp.]|nr:PRC-barrel domain-containing protein [Candidatus Saccharimonas sp.]